eukprot:8502828-Pyramimonas_sp.AAC.1
MRSAISSTRCPSGPCGSTSGSSIGFCSCPPFCGVDLHGVLDMGLALSRCCQARCSRRVPRETLAPLEVRHFRGY